jgi:hypothetical protein
MFVFVLVFVLVLKQRTIVQRSVGLLVQRSVGSLVQRSVGSLV